MRTPKALQLIGMKDLPIQIDGTVLKKIMEYKFGLVRDDVFHKEYEIQEIAEIMGLTNERVRQIIESSKAKLANECKQRIGEKI